jgi:hypothetical protein
MTVTYERTVSTTAGPAEVWALWSDVGSWHRWEPAVEPGARYLDRLTIGDLVIRIDHEVVAEPGGAAITVRTTIEGPGADDLGPMVTRDTPRALATLVELAQA